MKIILSNTQLVHCKDLVYPGVISQDLTCEKDVTRIDLASGIVRNLNMYGRRY